MLQVGQRAPDFELAGRDGKLVRLSDFAGRWVVVYFYPKDNTPGCTRQACAFRDAYRGFEELNLTVIGISKDSVASHQRFAEKHALPFVLLSDPERSAIEGFGVWQEKKLYGKVSMGVVRSTFVLDGERVVRMVFERAKPDSNAQEILDALRQDPLFPGVPNGQ